MQPTGKVVPQTFSFSSTKAHFDLLRALNPIQRRLTRLYFYFNDTIISKKTINWSGTLVVKLSLNSTGKQRYLLLWSQTLAQRWVHSHWKSENKRTWKVQTCIFLRRSRPKDRLQFFIWSTLRGRITAANHSRRLRADWNFDNYEKRKFLAKLFSGWLLEQ